jgi:hypothetical protein
MKVAVSDSKHGCACEVDWVNIIKNPTLLDLERRKWEPIAIGAVVSTQEYEYRLF